MGPQRIVKQACERYRRIATTRATIPRMIILRESGFITVPWKNGGGLTREILRNPAESTAFDWRLSLATIDSPGPFSAFAGFERTLVLVRGAGVELDFGQHGRARLQAAGQLVTFDGAWPVGCTLLDGPSSDLNLIVSRERMESASQSLRLSETEHVQTAGWEDTLVCCISGSVQLTNITGEVENLGDADVARCSPNDRMVTCAARDSTPAHVFVAHVRRRTGRS